MQPQENDVNKIMFINMVSLLAMSAMQQMGKLVDPATGKAEIHLEAAQATIDMLDMLFTKTKNNLDADETRLLKDTLMSLKMNYVESLEHKTDDGPAKTGSGKEEQTPNAQRPTPNVECRKTADGMPGPESNKEPPKDPKFHKNYA